MAMTLWPSESMRSHRCDPIKPAPPVIRMRIVGAVRRLWTHYDSTIATGMQSRIKLDLRRAGLLGAVRVRPST